MASNVTTEIVNIDSLVLNIGLSLKVIAVSIFKERKREKKKRIKKKEKYTIL
jgi:hypothetical protein